MIYLECYADEALVKSFGITSKKIKHAFSKGEVCNMLRKTNDNIGIVDEDPNAGKSSYEKQMLQRIIYEDEKLIFCEDTNSGNRLILIRPRLEEFILRIAMENRFSLESYRLSSAPKRLHDELMFRRNQQKFGELNKLLTDLLSKKDKTLVKLREFITK